MFNPDSDPTAYNHSIRQWSIWSFEKKYNKSEFIEEFIENTRDNFASQQWTAEIEQAVRGLLDNRWADIEQVLDATGLQRAVPEDTVADRLMASVVPTLQTLLLGGLIAGLVVGNRPTRRRHYAGTSVRPIGGPDLIAVLRFR